MRKLLPLLLLLLSWQTAQAQVPTMQEKLYYTCKVWGFVKYYHSEVSECRGQNWDSVLLHVLPMVRSASTNDEFNNALDTLLALAGPMAIATTPLLDTLPVELKRNRDWGWIASPVLRSDVQVQLDTIKNNFRPHAGCWVERNTYTTSNVGWLIFPQDSLGLNINTTANFPDYNHRCLMLFKYWNIIRYFNPYNYVLDVPIDSVLYNKAVPFVNATNANALNLELLKTAKFLDDAHVYNLTYSSYYQEPRGYFMPRIKLKYCDSQYVVVRSAIAGIAVGDVLISIDGLTMTQWEDSLKNYYSHGNQSVLGWIICDKALRRQSWGAIEHLVVLDSLGVLNSISVSCINPTSPTSISFFYDVFYPADSLKNVKWTNYTCDIGYVNIGNMYDADINPMYDNFRSKKAIIFDFRNGVGGNLITRLAAKIFPDQRIVAKFLEPDVRYPGLYKRNFGYFGLTTSSEAYTGKIILLFNENTWSTLEYQCMVLEAMPNVTKVGSQTMGSDGNITYWRLSQDLNVGFTSIGVFYPNGDSTQRIGIVPDIVVYPTPAGIRQGRDEVLEKALEVACGVGVKNTTAIQSQLSVYPNPAGNMVTISVGTATDVPVSVQLTDITGRVLRNTSIATGASGASIDVHDLAPGIYLIVAGNGVQNRTVKFVKE